MEVCDPCIECAVLPSVLHVSDELWQAGCPRCGKCAGECKDRLSAMTTWNQLQRLPYGEYTQLVGKSVVKDMFKSKAKVDPWQELTKAIKKQAKEQ